MGSTLPAPDVGDIFARWSVQPVAIAAAVVALAWYGWSLRRLAGAHAADTSQKSMRETRRIPGGKNRNRS